MEPSLTSFKAQFRHLILGFLWRQWSALGVSGHSRSGDPWIVDPEALLLFSTVLARHEPRLFDEILDWLHANGAWINLQRLTQLQAEYEPGDSTVLAAVAAYLSHDSAHAKWAVLTKGAVRDRPPTPLFPDLPFFGAEDPDFLRWGFQRGPFKLRGLSQPPRPDQPATFLFKMRALFGRVARADVMTWLLTHDSGHPAEIARHVGAMPRSVQNILNDLTLSGHVLAVRAGREKHFALRHDEWRFLLSWPDAQDFPQWIHWASLFRVLRRFHELLQRPDLETMSPYSQAIEIKRAIDVATLVKAGLPSHLTHLPGSTGAEFLATTLQDLETLLG
ncbi:MAG: hypothetical protein U0984_16335 [Prosthecobacter sp.]|nr:hypothetical protein [Prosthecobacter sp.]